MLPVSLRTRFGRRSESASYILTVLHCFFLGDSSWCLEWHHWDPLQLAVIGTTDFRVHKENPKGGMSLNCSVARQRTYQSFPTVTNHGFTGPPASIASGCLKRLITSPRMRAACSEVNWRRPKLVGCNSIRFHLAFMIPVAECPVEASNR